MLINDIFMKLRPNTRIATITISLVIIGISVFSFDCVKSGSKDNQAVAAFSKGADISWLPEMEKSGFVFYDSSGKAQDCLQILKDHGMNTVRLRTWVNPSNDPRSGHCSSSETVAMAVRAQKMGFRIMIDFHYSDSWADPGKQVKPAAWASHSFSQLLDDVYNYTQQVMTDLKSAGIYPEWVQVGNEINPGILLPDGSSSNLGNLAQLIDKGYDAVKSVSPKTLVIVHLANGYDNAGFRWFFDGFTLNGGKMDVIGLSFYPYWDKKNYKDDSNELSANMNDISSRYKRPVMVVETGGTDTAVNDTYNMIISALEKVRAVPDGKGLGVLYWEPEGAFSWSGYGLSCWGSDGKPTKALDAFLK
jgi:arabinogalactan endo-1,4-beta-galactosidase